MGGVGCRRAGAARDRSAAPAATLAAEKLIYNLTKRTVSGRAAAPAAQAESEPAKSR